MTLKITKLDERQYDCQHEWQLLGDGFLWRCLKCEAQKPNKPKVEGL